MRSTMKKIAVLLSLMVLILSFTGCGNKKDDLVGTWIVDSLEIKGTKFTADQVAAMSDGESSVKEEQIVLEEDGKATLIVSDSSKVVDWKKTEKGVRLGDAECNIIDGMICLEYVEDNHLYKIYYKKSTDQTFKKGGSTNTSKEVEEEPQGEVTEATEEATREAKEEVTTKAPAKKTEKTTKKKATTSKSGLSPEFKKAMDSYEEFFNDYVDFMKNYSNSDDVLGMLSEYTDYLTKYSDMMDKLDAVKEEDLSTEEYEYYIDVMARIQKKLLEITE